MGIYGLSPETIGTGCCGDCCLMCGFGTLTVRAQLRPYRRTPVRSSILKPLFHGLPTALAGHRTANGEPFARIDQLTVGDVVVVRTRRATFRYRLLDDVVVKPDKTWVIGDVTARLGLAPNSSVISLVTCSPKWSSEKRWVWWGVLIDGA